MFSELQRKDFRANPINGNSLSGRQPSHEAQMTTGLRRTIGFLLFLVLLCEPAVAQDRSSGHFSGSSVKKLSFGRSGPDRRNAHSYMFFSEKDAPAHARVIQYRKTARIRYRRLLADTHLGLRLYKQLACARCHPRQTRSLHHARSQIACRQCHGPDPIAGKGHYYSKLNPRRRFVQVCAKCHKGATKAFAAYIVHEPNPAFKTTQKSFPLLFYAFWAMMAIAVGTLAVFLPHSIFWGWREFRCTEKPDTADGSQRIRRFTRTQRCFHAVLIVTFVTQTATGLARLFGGTTWGRFLASLFGGYSMTLQIHKWVGLFMLAAFGVHVIYLLGRIEWRRFPGSIYGPDSLLPRFEDMRQAFQHLGWIVGKRPHPRFDRWAYWEKFDYWGVVWGVCILGSTGLILYNPVFSSRYMPGWVFNVVLWVHRIEAILAMAHVFTIHFFIGHLRRHSFPMDLTIFEGSTDFVKVSHERPAWIERMREQGTLQETLIASVPHTLKLVFYVFGFTIMGACLYLFFNSLVHGIDLMKYFFI
jgi:cytochrome b subunit of formate dehydrogenase